MPPPPEFTAYMNVLREHAVAGLLSRYGAAERWQRAVAPKIDQYNSILAGTTLDVALFITVSMLDHILRDHGTGI
jgi:hypothetical protein